MLASPMNRIESNRGPDKKKRKRKKEKGERAESTVAWIDLTVSYTVRGSKEKKERKEKKRKDCACYVHGISIQSVLMHVGAGKGKGRDVWVGLMSVH